MALGKAVGAGAGAAQTETPFHARHESLARLWTVLIVVEVAATVVFTAVGYHLALLRPPSLLHTTLRMRLFRVIVLDAFSLTAAASYLHLYGRVSRRIALGGAEAQFLDGIRLQTATLANTLVFALMSASIFLN